MGREIRRVPSDWQHPTHAQVYGREVRSSTDRAAHPLYDKDYPTACAEWKAGFLAWENDEGGERTAIMRKYDYDRLEYWDWHGATPDERYYRTRQWTPEEATSYQVYETVTEGTPVSPVLPTLDALRRWLMDRGMSTAGADQFIEWGSVPSGIMNIDTGEYRANFEIAEP